MIGVLHEDGLRTHRDVFNVDTDAFWSLNTESVSKRRGKETETEKTKKKHCVHQR